MGFQVAAVAPSPSSPSSPSTSSSRPLPAFLGGGRCAGGLPAVNWRTGVAMVRRRPRLARMPPARCALSASLDGTGGGGGDAEFMKRIEELAAAAGVPPPGAAGCCGGWPAASVERSATNVGLPLSLRMLKRRKQQQQQVVVAAAAAARHSRPLLGDSVRRAFSSMVFIVRELQSFALRQMRLRGGVVERVQAEMHASFVWLFQHIFAGTPALMLSLMLLLANFTVHSMGHSVAAAVPPAAAAAAALVVVDTTQRAEPRRFDVKTPFPVSGRTASVGGHSSGGGGKTPPPVAGATGDGRSDESSLYYRLRSRVAPPQPSAPPASGEVAAQDDDAGNADEQAVWETMLAEASKMMQASSEELSDSDVLRSLVAPVEAEVLETGEDHLAVPAEHTVTQRWYEHAVAAEPNNSLILANFAQFLYLVQSDHDRAEHYFKRAVRAEPADSEALSWYATFLWKARDDLAGAEESYQEAIAADPGNAHHAAAYAHFLWNTGASTGAAKQ